MKKENMVTNGKAITEKAKELTALERDVAQAKDKLAKAISWGIDFNLHQVMLNDGTLRQYITVAKGMPRDAKVALVQGKNHTIDIVVVGKDKVYEGSELSEDQLAYNSKIEQWQRTVKSEVRKRLNVALSEVAGWDELVAMTAILNRNSAISASNTYFA